MCDAHSDTRLCSGTKWRVKIKTDYSEESKLIYCGQAMLDMFGPNILKTKEIVVSAKKTRG